MTAKLKPCPFCNSAATPFALSEPSSCSNPNCSALGPDDPLAWNHRPFEAHAVEVLAREIAYRDIIIENLRDSKLVDDSGRELIREQARAEAKQLLGVKDE